MARRSSAIGLVISVAAAFAGAGCSGAVAPTSIPSGSPSIVSLTVGGNRSLTAIGETSQLTATAVYSDGSTKDVSSAVQWSSQNTGVAMVSSSGSVTATGIGSTNINAYLPDGGARRTIPVSVLLPGTFIVSGRVREPGIGSLRDVRVFEAVSGAATMSGGGGDYYLVGVRSLRLTFEKAGYERRTFDATPNASDEVPMQPVVRIAAGGSGTTTLAPNDMSYQVAPGSNCSPCRLIRVVTSGAGLLQVRLTWTKPEARLTLWIEGRRFDPSAGASLEVVADVPVVAGELVIYVAATNPLPGADHVPVTLTTLAR